MTVPFWINWCILRWLAGDMLWLWLRWVASSDRTRCWLVGCTSWWAETLVWACVHKETEQAQPTVSYCLLGSGLRLVAQLLMSMQHRCRESVVPDAEYMVFTWSLSAFAFICCVQMQVALCQCNTNGAVVGVLRTLQFLAARSENFFVVDSFNLGPIFALMSCEIEIDSITTIITIQRVSCKFMDKPDNWELSS